MSAYSDAQVQEIMAERDQFRDLYDALKDAAAQDSEENSRLRAQVARLREVATPVVHLADCRGLHGHSSVEKLRALLAEPAPEGQR